MPFAPNKTIKELGIDTTRKFRVVRGRDMFLTGDILVLEYDDKSCCPYFRRLTDNVSRFFSLFRLEYADEPKPTFKVGDKVRSICAYNTGNIGTITKIGKNNYVGMSNKIVNEDYNGYVIKEFGSSYYSSGEIESVEELDLTIPFGFQTFSDINCNVNTNEIYKAINKLTNTSPEPCVSGITKIMNGVVEFAKNLTLSADEKLLRKYGLKDSQGNYTQEAWEIVKMDLLKAGEAKLLEVAKAKQEEDNK